MKNWREEQLILGMVIGLIALLIFAFCELFRFFGVLPPRSIPDVKSQNSSAPDYVR